MKKERNNAIMLQCDNAAMPECHRAWSIEQGARGKGQAAGFGWRHSRTIVPLEKGGGDFGAGGLKFYNSLFLISYFLLSENVKYRIRNNESGNEEASYKLTATYPFPNPEISGRDRQLQTRGRAEACQRATHLTTPVNTLVNTPVKTTPVKTTPDTTPNTTPDTTPTGLTTLSGWTTLSGCSKNEIQFSKYPASGGTVIHRAQAVRACLLPFLPALTKNGFTAFFRHGSFFNNN